MRRAAALVLVPLLGACGDTGATTTPGAPVPATLDELDAALRPAAQTLLDADGVEITVHRLNEDGVLAAVDWLDWRGDADFALFLSRMDARGDVLGQALVTVDGAFYTAVDTGGFWEQIDRPVDPRMPASIDLRATADGATVRELLQRGVDAEVTRKAEGDGERWTLIDPQFHMTVEWAIDGAGALSSFAMFANEGVLLTTYLEEVHTFTPLDDPEPIVAPAVGAALKLDELGLPDHIQLPG